MKPKLIRIATIPASLDKLLEGQLAFMDQYYEVIAISSNETELKALAQKEAIRYFYVDLTRQITPIRDLKALWRLYLFFRKEKPDIVHTHTPKAGTVGMIAAKLARVPIRMHTIAGLPLLTATGKKRVLLNVVEKITSFCANHVYPNSHGLKKIIESEKLCSKNKLKVLCNGSSNGIDTDHFDPELFSKEDRLSLRKQLDISADDFVFVFVGRLVSDKGVNELVKAFDNLSKNKDKIKLLLVGSGEHESDSLKDETLEIIKKHPDIISVGLQKDVRPYFMISDILAFPSYREGFPNVVMQSGAMGLPSIVSDINGCNEIIVHKQNGWILKDIESLEEVMAYFLTDSDLIQKMQSEARNMIVTRYQRKTFWVELLHEYRWLLNR